ncbi:hypothetical protein LZ30DRAFT_464665 [Colletotrichum cereale]|nr:hypothetical protein LZ30DRAFT_464665 [Colletotrichum cereale]
MGGGPEIVSEAPPDPEAGGIPVSKDAYTKAQEDINAVHMSEEYTGHQATPDTEKCDEVSPRPPPSDETVAKDNGCPENKQDTGHTKDAVKQTTALVINVSNPTPHIPPEAKARWAAVRGQSPLYSQPPWSHGRQLRISFAEWVLYELYTRTISLQQLIAEVKGIYAGYHMIESKCIEVDQVQNYRLLRRDIDVIPFLEATPDSVLIYLQRGGVEPEETIRNTLRKKIKGIVVQSPWDGANGRSDLDLHVPTIEEALHGYLVAQESRAKESRSPDYQSLVELTTKTIGDQGSAKEAADRNTLNVGYELLEAIDKSTEEAKRNITRQSEEEEAQEAKRKAARADQEAKSKAEKQARQNAIHRVCECCGAPLCTHQTVVKAKKSDDEKAMQKNNNVEPWTLPTDSRPLEDTSQYKKIGEVYYRFVDGRWMNISLNDDQYRALTALHITGMHELHDFFLVLSHPKASAALRGLSAKYDMPARFWRHSIHTYLEVLRPRLPESLEHMIGFILKSYSMMQLLEETTNSGSYTTECTGDLARYRFAIEDEDANAKLHWKGVAMQQYSRVLDLDPTLGRLYHHNSILSSDYTSRFFNILKSLTVSQPFTSAWDTMVSTLLTQFVAPEGQTSTTPVEVLSSDEDNLYTSIARLLLATAPSRYLQQSCSDTCKDTHLLAFDRLLRLVAGLDDPKSTLLSKLLDLFQTSMLQKTSSATIDSASSLVGPASHYIGSASYIRRKTTTGAAFQATRGEYAKKANTAPSSSTGLFGWFTAKLSRLIPWPEGSVQSFSVRPSPELGLVLCQLLLLDKDFAVVDRAAQLLSVVNLRILARPVTHDLKLWEYLHVLLVFMRSLNTRPDLKERFGYAFHPELMAPLLNLLLRRIKDRGGDAWKALFRPEFPMLWVPLNTKAKPEKYNMNTMDAQRVYFARKREQEAEGTKTDNVTMVFTDENTKAAAEDGSDSRAVMDHMAEGNTQMSTEASTNKLGANLETDKVNPDSVDYDCAQTVVQPKAGDLEHDETKNKLFTAEGAKTDDVVSESHIDLDEPAQRRLYTVVLPEDLLLRGFSFAKQTPSPPEPEQPPSEKQIAREQWEEKEAKTAQLTQDKVNCLEARKREKEGRKQQKRIARGADHRTMCADCQILDDRIKADNKGKKVLNHAATSEACQARYGCRRIDTQKPEVTKTAEGCQTITLDTVTEVAKEQSGNNFKETKTEIKGGATPADNPTADVPADADGAAKVISDGTQSVHWVIVDKEKPIIHNDDTVVKEATHVLPQETENLVADAGELDLDELPHLGLLFGEADEGDEAVEENSSAPGSVTKPDENEGISTMCRDAEDAAAEKGCTSPGVTDLETDYGISAMFAQADAEFDEAKSKAERAQEKARIEEKALRLEPYFYPPGFFEKSKYSREDLACRDYVQASEVTDNRELRIVWAAISVKCFFSFQADKNGDHFIDVPGQMPVPMPYSDAQMPALIIRDDGSRVFYVDPTVAEIVAKRDNLWQKRAEEADQRRWEFEEKKRENEQEKQEEEEKKQPVTEVEEPTAAQESKDTQNEATGEIEGTQVEKPTSLHPSTPLCSPMALGSPQEPFASIRENEAADNGIADGPSDPAANVPALAGAVTQLTRAAVAALPTRDEAEVEFPTKEWWRGSTEEWVEAQGDDGVDKKEGDSDDDKNSEGWTKAGGNSGNLAT